MHRVQNQFAGLVASDNKRARMLVTVSVFDRSERRLHQTFRLKAWTNRNDERMISLDLNDGDWAAGVYATKVLHHNVATGEKWTAKGQSDRLLDYAARAALAFAETGTVPTPSNGRVEAVEASLCGRCGLTLTDPVSIERGIGPECYGKETGTTTIRSRPTRLEKAPVEQQASDRRVTETVECSSQLEELPGQTWEDIFK